MEFCKLHGLGNDFVVVDRRTENTPVPSELAVSLCRRHRGVGADGVLSVLRSERAPIAMHVTNADGSIAEMCGNGLRCVVRWAVDRNILGPEGGLVDTGAGLKECQVTENGDIRVAMGPAILEPAKIPVESEEEQVVDSPFNVDGHLHRLTAVSMGNPHAVHFAAREFGLVELAQRWGARIERHPRFPERTNVEFARLVGEQEIDLVVWERGSGLTQACGTGACATAVAAFLQGRVRADLPVRVNLPGGPLVIELASDLSQVWMTGPAVEVFRGRIKPEILARLEEEGEELD